MGLPTARALQQHWKELEIHLGMSQSEANITGSRGQNANVGGKLKSTGTDYWRAPNAGADNSTGFTALPGGYRLTDSNNAQFFDIGNSGTWWTSTSSGSENAIGRRLDYLFGSIVRNNYTQSSGRSVRCIAK